MGIVEDLTNVIRKGPEVINKLNSVKINTKSIAKGAKDSTFQFPCLVTSSVPIDMASTIARTLDQVYASFTQTWLSMNSMFDISVDPTPLDYLRKLHQNLKIESTEATLDEQCEEKIYKGDYKLYLNESKTEGMIFSVASEKSKALYENNKELLNEFMSEFNLNPIEVITEADEPAEGEGNEENQDLLNQVVKSQAINIGKNRNGKPNKPADKQQVPKLLNDRDIKRANELIPYGIQVRLIALNDKKEFVQYVDFIVGVKTVLHIVQSDDAVTNIANALQNRSLGFKLLKWTTGEISLFKSIIFNIQGIKDTIVQNNNKSKSPFFPTLFRLKNKKFGVRNLTVPHGVIPNSTLAISSYEVNQLLDKYGIDLTSDATAKKLIESMFLMSLVILDEGTGTVSIMYDGNKTFQTYLIDTLERDNAMNSNKLGKEIGRMISR